MKLWHPTTWFLALCCVTLSTSTLAQDTLTSRFSLGILGASDYYGYTYHYSIDSTAASAVSQPEVPKFSIGLVGSLALNNNWKIRTGLVYSNKGLQIKYDNDHLPLSALDSDIPEYTRFNVTYLEVPLWISFYFLKRDQFSCFATLGAVPSFLVNNRELTFYADGSNKTTSFMTTDYQPVLLNSYTGVAFQYHITKVFSMILEPRYQYFSIVPSKTLTTGNAASLGIATGFTVAIQ